MTRPRTRPFFPSQLESGATYVVDGRSGKVVANFRRSFDTTERWRAAVRDADLRNDAFERNVYARRRLVSLLVLICLVGVVASYSLSLAGEPQSAWLWGKLLGD